MKEKDNYLTNVIIKLSVIILASFLIFVILSNKEKKEIEENSFSYDTRFATVEEDGTHRIIVDKETNVLYLECETSSNRYGITVLLNSDGTPMLLNENKGEE